VAIDAERRLDHVEQLLGDVAGIHRAADALHEDGELIATEPRHDVAGAHLGGEPLRHLLQQLVAGLVAQRVVDHLELVDVEEEQRHAAALAPGAGGGALELVLEVLAVAELGERVELRELAELQRRALAFHGIADGAQERAALVLPLDEIVLHPLVEDVHGQRLVRLAGERHHGNAAVRGLDGVHALHAAGIAQLQAEQHGIEAARGQRPACIVQGPCMHQFHIVGPVQQGAEEAGVLRIVFDQQQFHGSIRPGHRRAGASRVPSVRRSVEWFGRTG